MIAGNQQERLLDPWYVTGWYDGEGCFSVSVHRHPGSRFKWLVDPAVQTYQHRDSVHVLEEIKDYFGCGAIRSKGPNSNVMTYSIESRRDIITSVFPHFVQYPLRSRKAEDFNLFRQIVELLERKHHSTIDGLIHIISLAFKMNPHGKNRKYLLEDIIRDLRESSPSFSDSNSSIMRCS